MRTAKASKSRVTVGFIDGETGVLVPAGKELDIVAEMKKLARGRLAMSGVEQYAAKHFLEGHAAGERRKTRIRKAHRCGNLLQFPKL
jgi:hypothetical protein